MPLTVEAVYHDGIVELKQKPQGIHTSRALVIFLDDEDIKTSHPLNLDTIQSTKSTVDKWVGMIEGADIGDWKAERRSAIEGKRGENSR
jgi:hypothetical protein